LTGFYRIYPANLANLKNPVKHMIRPKSFLTYFAFCATPLLLLAAFNYWNTIGTVNSTISSFAQSDLNTFNVNVDEILRDKERSILRLALTPNVRRVVTNQTDADLIPLPGNLDPHFHSLTLFGSDRQPLWCRTANNEWKSWIPESESNRPDHIPQPDQKVWGTQGNVSIERPGSIPSTFEYATPIHDERGTSTIGALLGALDLESVFSSAARGLESNAGSTVVVLNTAGQLVYHSDRTLKLRPVSEALQGLDSIAHAMKNNESGLSQFSSPSSSYIAAYSPIPRLNVSIAVARSRSQFISSAHRWGIANLALALLIALAAAFVLERHVQRRSRGIARVTEDLSAIAKGELDRRIILQSSDDARGIADNINVVTERLRAQIAREEESRQFESFVRLSAMLTHDLKNAIEGLSLTVGNMEKHFDNPQFRSDALKGLTSATDKLKALVARLARPLTSLSGEHKRPTNVDLVPIIKRVIAMTAEPQRGKHTIVTRLPQSLFALVDPGRIEEVIENLVLNALEAMETGGTLTIEAGQTENGAPTVSISDTGRGMSRSFIESRLFRPFATTKKTGIGLGLYTCREVIKASAGSIEVDSVEGAGTTFRVVLPSTPHDRP
jgi:signal transduction histidine kinase